MVSRPPAPDDMTGLTVVLGVVAGAALSWWLTGVVRRYAIARALLDIPNPRSSHTTPTPRGGGLAIAGVALTGVALAGAMDPSSRATAIALGGGGLLVAWVGWLDDRRGLSAGSRVLVQVVAAAWALYWLGGLPSLTVGDWTITLGPWGSILGAVGIVWCTNLYNFMDGVDGIAAGEAVSVAGIGTVLLWLSGNQGLSLMAATVGAASAGFLWWNWSPARIFMGDVGSGTLGFLFAGLAVASENAGAVPLAAWLLLLGAFIFDATATLLRRVLRVERWYQAHQRHAYQRAVQAGLSHARVSGAVLLLNAGLGLLAAAVWARPDRLLVCLVAASLLLGAVYWLIERIRPMNGESTAPDAGAAGRPGAPNG
ncbi:MAG: MraY family glycosyltransferase [Gemmatimonadales bacterium]